MNPQTFKELTVPQIKAATKKRDGYRCQDCGISEEQHIQERGRGLEVHRVVPGSDYSIDGCVTFCLSCHDKRPTERHIAAAEAFEALQSVLVGFEAPRLDALPRFPVRAKAMAAAIAQYVSEKTGKEITQSTLLYALVSREHARIFGTHSQENT